MITSVSLDSFRSLKKARYDFSPNTTIIIGSNASGKTNILESIYFLATGKSFKARTEEEVVQHTAEITRIKGEVGTEDKIILEIVLTRGVIKIGEKVQKVPKKKLLVNSVPRRLIDFAGNLKVVLFVPQDLLIVTDSPSVRRRFLNNVLFQTDREYRRSLISYEKALRQRNKLLLKIRNGEISRTQLVFWDKVLIKNGNYLSGIREDFLQYANDSKQIGSEVFSLEYDKSAISESRLDQYASREIAAATTLVGPHRDDFIFKVKEFKSGKVRDLSAFGSRGEQRMGVLWLKLAEMKFIEERTKVKPTLLLDDIFSELDSSHRTVVVEIAKNNQAIITTADPYFVEEFDVVQKINIDS